MNWVSIKERLPDKDAAYLIHAPSADPDKPLIALAWYDPSGFGWSLLASVWIEAITHWMPLPEPPTENAVSASPVPRTDDLAASAGVSTPTAETAQGNGE